MRFRRLLIKNYGCFKHADLAFATEPGRITLVVAPNGTGKSVLRQAFHDLLFDIPLKSPMSFRFGYKGMALHASAIAGDGVPFDFAWARQGEPKRTTSDPIRYAAIRNESTPLQLEQLFALDTARLRKGGTDLKGGETLAGALLSGTGELAPAKAVGAEIAARRDANWGLGKSKPPLNAALAALVRTRADAHAAVQRPAHREQQERDLEAQRAVHAAAKKDHQDALANTRRLNRIGLTRAHIEALSIAEAWLDAHQDAPALPSGLDQHLAGARAEMATAQTDWAAKLEAFGDAERQAALIERDKVVAEHAAALSRLPGMLGEAEKTAKDIVDRRTERAATLAQMGTALRDIGVTVPVGQASSLIPSVAVTAHARTSIVEYTGYRKAWELAGVRVRDAQRALTDAEGELATAVPAPDGLAALLREIRSDRSPVQHAIAVADAASAAQAHLRAALAQTPGWTNSAAALRGLSPPSDASFERLDAARNVAVALQQDRAAVRDRLTTEQDAVQRSLASLHERPLPDAAAITAARVARDHGWRLVQQRAFLPGQPDIEAERAYAGSEPLALAFERHIRVADDLADRRIAELDRVNEAERLARLATELEAQCDVASQAAAAAAVATAKAREDWAVACAPLGLGADSTIADLRGLLAARLRVIETMQAVEAAEGAAVAVTGAHRAWAARLAVVLEVPLQPLPELLALGDARQEAALRAERASTLQQARLDAARREQQAADEALDTARTELSTWEIGWAGTLAQLGRPAAERPDATAAVLERLAILDQLDQKATMLGRRIADMQADLDGFGAIVDGLAHALGEAGQPTPAMAARALIARRDRAANLDSGWDQAQLSLDQRRLVLQTAEQRQRQAQQAMDAVIAAAGAVTAAEADARIAAAREHARHAQMRDEALSGLREHGEGRTHDQLRQEAAATPVEQMAGERDAAEASVTDAGARAEAAAVQLDKLRIAFDDDAARTSAIETRAAYEAAATLYTRRLEEQLVLQIASNMLARAMEAVEQDAGGGGLQQISDAFAAVTDGAYGIAMAEDGPGGAELHAVETRFPEERKELHQLSEGTRDQLYLALRLVALRDHCAAASPLPFIADDILQTFDDDRALAALRALVDLSSDVQVIVLTHHQHVARLAESLAPGCVLIQRL